MLSRPEAHGHPTLSNVCASHPPLKEAIYTAAWDSLRGIIYCSAGQSRMVAQCLVGGMGACTGQGAQLREGASGLEGWQACNLLD